MEPKDIVEISTAETAVEQEAPETNEQEAVLSLEDQLAA